MLNHAENAGAGALLLSIEHSGRDGAIALSRAGDGAVLRVDAVPRGGRHQVDLMVYVAEAFKAVGAMPADLAAVVVAAGPGGFTGLRVAVATAKSLCWATGAGLVAVPTLDVLVAQHPGAVVALNVKFKTAWSGGAVGPAAIRPVAELRDLADRLGVPLVMDGEGGDLPVAPSVEVLARLGADRWRGGERADVVALEPLYVRETEAERKWRERSS